MFLKIAVGLQEIYVLHYKFEQMVIFYESLKVEWEILEKTVPAIQHK